MDPFDFTQQRSRLIGVPHDLRQLLALDVTGIAFGMLKSTG